ncbi:histidine-containing phosphotransfer protein 4-like protein [Tanacetum coccineum]
MVCFIQQMKTSSWFDITIVTRLVAKTMEEVPRDFYFSWVTMPLHGLQRSNLLLPCPAVKQNYFAQLIELPGIWKDEADHSWKRIGAIKVNNECTKFQECCKARNGKRCIRVFDQVKQENAMLKRKLGMV